jgi:hypothetical protein
MMSVWPYFDEKRIDLVSTDSIQRRSFNKSLLKKIDWNREKIIFIV